MRADLRNVTRSTMSLAPLISVTSEVREGYEKYNPKKKLTYMISECLRQASVSLYCAT
jgi:hypothetical protein